MKKTSQPVDAEMEQQGPQSLRGGGENQNKSKDTDETFQFSVTSRWCNCVECGIEK